MGIEANDLQSVSVGGTNFAVRKKYKNLKVIGRGSYGVVVSCGDAESKEKVAIKRIAPMSKHASDAKHVLREIRCMRLLGNHTNIVKIVDLFVNESEDELYIVMPLLDSDLHRIIQSPQALTESHHRFFMYQLVRGVKYMHEQGIIHRDLKPGNLLVTRNCELKITDFGLARLASVANGNDEFDTGPMTQHVVTRWYRPPELMLTPDGRYTNAVDLWSVGCILAELLGRKPLFPGKNFVHQLQLIFNVIGSPEDTQIEDIKNKQARKFLDSVRGKLKVPFAKIYTQASAAANDVLEQLLIYTPALRARAEFLLDHEYFANLSYAEARPVQDPQPDLSADLFFETKQLTPADLRTEIFSDVSAYEPKHPSLSTHIEQKDDLSLGTTHIRRRTATTTQHHHTAQESEKRVFSTTTKMMRPLDNKQPPSKTSSRSNKSHHLYPAAASTLSSSASNSLYPRSSKQQSQSYANNDVPRSTLYDTRTYGRHHHQPASSCSSASTTKKFRGGSATIPISPKFSKMSWQKK